MLYESEIFQPLHTGMTLKAYVKQVREDGKIDLILQKPGFEKVDDFSKTLLEYIREHGGRINLNDKSLRKIFMLHLVSARRPLRKEWVTYIRNT